jgi:hypothetical protein
MTQTQSARQLGQTSKAQLSTRHPFHALVLSEKEKVQRDQLSLNTLLTHRQASKQRLERRDYDLDKILATRRPVNKTATKPPKRKVAAAIMSFYRPLSSANALDHVDGRTAAELDFEPTAKPFMVIALPQANDLENSQRSFAFTLATEDGLVHILQAITAEDRSAWVSSVNKATSYALEQRRTFLKTETIAETMVEVPTPSRIALSQRAGEHFTLSGMRDSEMC